MNYEIVLVFIVGVLVILLMSVYDGTPMQGGDVTIWKEGSAESQRRIKELVQNNSFSIKLKNGKLSVSFNKKPTAQDQKIASQLLSYLKDAVYRKQIRVENNRYAPVNDDTRFVNELIDLTEVEEKKSAAATKARADLMDSPEFEKNVRIVNTLMQNGKLVESKDQKQRVAIAPGATLTPEELAAVNFMLKVSGSPPLTAPTTAQTSAPVPAPVVPASESASSEAKVESCRPPPTACRTKTEGADADADVDADEHIPWYRKYMWTGGFQRTSSTRLSR